MRFITRVADARGEREDEKKVAEPARGYAVMETESLEKMLEQQMREAAAAMDFELAAQLRDQLFELRARARCGVGERSRGGCVARRALSMIARTPLVPPLASHGHLALRRVGARRLGRALRPRRAAAARRHARRRARRREDDARAGDLSRLRRDRGGDESDVRARARYAAPRSPVFHLDLYRLERPTS